MGKNSAVFVWACQVLKPWTHWGLLPAFSRSERKDPTLTIWQTLRIGCFGWIGCLAVSAALSAESDGWTRFRGPNGAGQADSPDIPLRWTSADYRWRVSLPGIGYSSPVVRGERLFVTSADPQTAGQTLWCLNTADGSVSWRHAVDSKPHPKHRFNCYASSTPALDESQVYFCAWTAQGVRLLAFRQSDGREVWRHDLGPFVGEHGFGTSPMVFEDLVIVSNDQDGRSFVIALDGASGSPRWQTERRSEKAGYATPCLWQPPQGKPQLILSSWAHGVSGLDPQTGRLLWELPVFQNRVVASPVVAAGLIFASAGVGGVGREMYAIQPGDPEHGIQARVAYTLEGPLPYVPMPVAKGNLLFLWHDRGVVSCLEASSGKVLWRERVGGEFFSSPIRIGDRLYNTSRDGQMVVLAATEKYELLARFPLGEATHSTPAVAGDCLYLRTVSHVMALPGKKK